MCIKLHCQKDLNSIPFSCKIDLGLAVGAVPLLLLRVALRSTCHPLRMRMRVYFTHSINERFSESQLPHKIVNLLFDNLSDDFK